MYCKLSIKHVKALKQDGAKDSRYETITEDKEMDNIWLGIEVLGGERHMGTFSDPTEDDVLVEYKDGKWIKCQA